MRISVLAVKTNRSLFSTLLLLLLGKMSFCPTEIAAQHLTDKK
jgi:hypothetical protein